MRLLTTTPDGALTLAHAGHQFRVALASLAHPPLADGTPNAALLATDWLTCTDDGCDYTCRAYFPADGDPTARAIHAAVAEGTGLVARRPRRP